jgi:hypothetical protein
VEEEQSCDLPYDTAKGLKFSLSNRRRLAESLPYLAMLGVVIGIIWAAIPSFRVVPLWTVLAGLGGCVAALYKQQLDDTKAFNDLFRHFTERFGTLNGQLDRIVLANPEIPLEPDERDALMDYFNLCAEEFLYFKSGYLDDEVWRSWIEGMKFFAKNPRIAAVWRTELLSQDAYYGFPPSLVGL